MSFSEIPPPPEVSPGSDPPFIRVRPPGPQSRTWMTRAAHVGAPMGPRGARGSIVYATAKGANVIDVDGNRYVDLAAGFGAMLLGHGHPSIDRVLELQPDRLLQALGDVHPSQPKIALMLRLAERFPGGDAQVILAQSGADAVGAAIQTAVLATRSARVIAFAGGYHGLSYAPLAACGFRESYRAPFAAQLGSHVTFVEWPRGVDAADLAVERVRLELAKGGVAAVLFEPVLGRAGVIPPPEGFLAELARLSRAHSAVVIADEIWTGLGRSGAWLASASEGVGPDLVCFGKGLGGGLPISACVGRRALMAAWSQPDEVVHTSTFAGAALACTAAIATLDTLAREKLVERAASVGASWLAALQAAIGGRVGEVRGRGLMIAIDRRQAGGGADLARELLERGYITSTGGADRSVLVLTPPLNIDEELLSGFVASVREVLRR